MSFSMDELNVSNQKVRVLHTKIEILGNDLKVLGEVQGDVINGDYNRTSEIGVRSSCSITMQVDKSWLPSPSSPIWCNRIFRIYMGIENNSSGEIVWTMIGTYHVVDPEFEISDSGRYEVTIQGEDMVVMLNGDMGGGLKTKTVVESGGSVGDAIRSVLKEEANITNVKILDDGLTVPYDLEFGLEENVWDVISELVELYLDYEAFFDIDGTFVFQRASNLTRDSVYFSMDDFSHVVGYYPKFIYSDIRNQITVYGRVNDKSGITPSYTFTLSDTNSPDHPFTIEKMGEPFPRSITIEEDKYYTVNQCKMRADYELNKRNNLNEVVNIECLPLYFLDVNKILYIKDEESGIDGRYCIDEISCGVSFEDTMSITCHRLYAPRFESGALESIEHSFTEEELLDVNYDGVLDSKDGYVAKKNGLEMYKFPNYIYSYGRPTKRNSPYAETISAYGSDQTKAIPARGLNIRDYIYWIHGKYKISEGDTAKILYFIRIRQQLPSDGNVHTAWKVLLSDYYNYCRIPPDGDYYLYDGAWMVDGHPVDDGFKYYTFERQYDRWWTDSHTICLCPDGKLYRMRMWMRDSWSYKMVTVLNSKGLPYQKEERLRTHSVYSAGPYESNRYVDNTNPSEYGLYRLRNEDPYYKGSFPPDIDSSGKIIVNSTNVSVLKNGLSYSNEEIEGVMKEYLLLNRDDCYEVNNAIKKYGFKIVEVSSPTIGPYVLMDPDGNTILRDINANWMSHGTNAVSIGINLYEDEYPTWEEKKSLLTKWNGEHKQHSEISDIFHYKELLKEGMAHW